MYEGVMKDTPDEEKRNLLLKEFNKKRKSLMEHCNSKFPHCCHWITHTLESISDDHYADGKNSAFLYNSDLGNDAIIKSICNRVN